MYEKSLTAAEAVLRTQPEDIVTVRKVWEAVITKAKTEGFEVASLPDFTAMLDADKRFQIIPARTEDEIAEQEVPEGDVDGEEMEQLGFFPEDRVRLKAVAIPKEQAPLPEEEEEIASIRHTSFITQDEKSKKPVKAKAAGTRKKPKQKKTVKTKAKKIKIVKKKKTSSKAKGKKRKK